MDRRILPNNCRRDAALGSLLALACDCCRDLRWLLRLRLLKLRLGVLQLWDLMVIRFGLDCQWGKWGYLGRGPHPLTLDILLHLTIQLLAILQPAMA